MKNKEFSWELFNKVPVVGIIRNLSFEEVENIFPVYYESRLTTIEITVNTPGADEIIQYSVDRFGEKLNVGAGTVCNLKDLSMALDSGSQFIVTPVLNVEVIKACVERNIPVFSGAFTPTEIYKAWTAGSAMVKVFPATSLGPEYIKDILGPLNEIKLMPTGGVNIENSISFLKAGAQGLGIGSQLFNKKFIKEKNWDALKNTFNEMVSKIDNYKITKI
ncbi:bifunctional 4-hydroxy-2-oxoglutarate aldolase/2-dehydro-3-deoxy-phosphogluconate aldolase [soil metagenome]